MIDYISHRSILEETIYLTRCYIKTNEKEIKKYLASKKEAYKRIDKGGLNLVYSIIYNKEDKDE